MRRQKSDRPASGRSVGEEPTRVVVADGGRDDGGKNGDRGDDGDETNGDGSGSKGETNGDGSGSKGETNGDGSGSKGETNGDGSGPDREGGVGDEVRGGGDRSVDLWLDELARRLGAGWLANRLPVGLPPSYLYAVTAVLGWRVVSVAYNLTHGIPLIYDINPYFALQPVVLLGGVYGARSLARSYDRVMDEMHVDERSSDPEWLRNVVPRWLPWTLFGVGVTLQLVRAALNVEAFNPTGVVANFVVFPFVYGPVVVQFAVVYVGIEFVAPWRLSKSDMRIDFLDPNGVGGLRPLGELVKKAYYYIVAGLLAYALITYAPFVPDWQISVAAGTIFTGVWAASVATVAFAVFMLHRFMRREKRIELHRLEEERRSHLKNPWSVRTYEVPADAQDRIDDIEQRIDRVSATREYPATFSIWTQLLLSVAIPKGLQLLLAGV